MELCRHTVGLDGITLSLYVLDRVLRDQNKRDKRKKVGSLFYFL
jgi:hypothetical protein